MDHAAAHRYQQRANVLHQPRVLERADTARRQSQVDGAAALSAGTARIGSTIPHTQGAATVTDQHDSEKRAGEAGTDYVDRLVEVPHRDPSGNLLQNLCEALSKHQHLLEAIIQWNGRDPDHIRLTPVTNDTEPGQPLENLPATLAGTEYS